LREVRHVVVGRARGGSWSWVERGDVAGVGWRYGVVAGVGRRKGLQLVVGRGRGGTGIGWREVW
jgi:hypothetical protein